MAYQYPDLYNYQQAPDDSYPISAFIAPHMLINNMSSMNPLATSPASPRPGHYIPSYCQPQPTHVSRSLTHHKGVKLDDVGVLEPGVEHQLSQDPIATPQSIIDGSYRKALDDINSRDIVIIVPRLEMYIGKPSVPTIVFSANGKPGPYLHHILKAKVVLDGPYDLVFREMGWKRTSLTIDWPGTTIASEYIKCVEGTRDSTRTEIARAVAVRVAELLMRGANRKLKWGPQVINEATKRWDLTQINHRDVRLIGINYYRRTWVPVLAVDNDFDAP